MEEGFILFFEEGVDFVTGNYELCRYYFKFDNKTTHAIVVDPIPRILTLYSAGFSDIGVNRNLTGPMVRNQQVQQ